MAFPAITSRKKQFKGTGLKGPFVFDKYLLSEAELIVIKTSGGIDTTLVLNTDYTTSLVKKSNGIGYLSAVINLTNALEKDETLTVEAQLTYSQTLDLVNGVEFDLGVFEAAMDKLALMSAQLSAQLQTTLNVPNSSSITDTEISSFIPSGYLRINGTATGVETVNPVDLMLGTSLATTNNNFIVGNGTSWISTTPTNTRAALGLGTIALQNSNVVTITGGAITGIIPITVTDGGTGANNVIDARTNLGLSIGVNVQPYSSELAALSSYNTNGILTRTATNTYVGRTLIASTGLTMTNGNGVSGSPILSYNISGLSEETSPLITDTVLIQKNDGTVNKVQIQNLPSYNTSGAPADASYVAISNSGSLTAERVITAGSGVSITDGGANSTLTASVNINGLTVDGSPDLLNDYIMTYDANASGLKKTLLNNVKGYNGSYKMLLSNSFSGVTAVNFSSTYITSTYSAYAIVLTNYVDTNGTGVNISYSTDNGSTFVSGASALRGNFITTNTGSTTTTNTGSGGTTRFLQSPDLASTAIKGSGVFYIFGPSTGTVQSALWHSSYALDATPVVQQSISGGRIPAGAAINYIRLNMPSNATGRVTLYGIL